MIKCKRCNGTGQLSSSNPFDDYIDCPDCNGGGKIVEDQILVSLTMNLKYSLSLHFRGEITYLTIQDKTTYKNYSHLYHDRERAYKKYEELSKMIVFGQQIGRISF